MMTRCQRCGRILWLWQAALPDRDVAGRLVFSHHRCITPSEARGMNMAERGVCPECGACPRCDGPCPHEIRAAAEAVVWFDWSDNDSDAVRAIERLRQALVAPAEREGRTP